jgi:rhodanese-related sulfurtransferase
VVTSKTSDDETHRAAAIVASRGYGDVKVLTGGNDAWAEAGYVLITNFNALSKALGEFVERRYDTPKITVEELKRRLDDQEDLVVLDSRPFDEYEAIAIPTGVDAPGAELVYRAFDAVPDETTPVVVNCAGRTRAIIGAQALINAGFPNPVYSLENGTAAWLIAGYEPAVGQSDLAPAPTGKGLERAVEAARSVAARFGVRDIDREELDAYRSEAGERSLYLFDVRTREEYEAGHLEGARHVPGGQLVQTSDFHIGSRKGRVVVVDDADGVRANGTAAWLVQLGLPDVTVYRLGANDPLVQGPDVPPRPEGDVSLIGVDELAAHREDHVVVDLEQPSPYVANRHFIPGSYVARRFTLSRTLPQLDDARPVVLTSGDGEVARWAAADLVGSHPAPVFALDGGTSAWKAAGHDTLTGPGQPAFDPAEAIPAPVTLEERRQNLEWYVAWGDEIVGELERDGLVAFVAAPEG